MSIAGTPFPVSLSPLERRRGHWSPPYTLVFMPVLAHLAYVDFSRLAPIFAPFTDDFHRPVAFLAIQWYGSPSFIVCVVADSNLRVVAM